MRKNKFFSIIMVLSFFCLVFFGANLSFTSGSTQSELDEGSLVTSCYKSESTAEWCTSNGQSYLYVSADNYYDLGYLEGQNLGFQIAWFKLVIMLQAQEYGIPYEIGYSYSQQYLDYIPENYIDEMHGMADAIDVVTIPLNDQIYTISIDYLDVLFIACFFDIWYGQLLPTISGFSQPPLIQGLCTAIGTSTGRRPILGQTMDLTYMMAPTGVWVHSKVRNHEIFNFRLGGIASLGGVNKRGIAISVNLLEVANIGCYGMPVAIRYRYALENSRTVSMAQKIILSTPFTLGWNYIIKGRRIITAIETIPNMYDLTRIRHGDYTFDANIYENPLFKAYMLYPTKYISRYEKASELCKMLSQDRKLDLKDLFSIISYYDDTEASILRLFTTSDPLVVGTVARFVSKSKNVYFWNVLSGCLEFGHLKF